MYVERYLEDPRHVEVQVLADAHGNVIHLGERDCTIQRRHQKLVEETPSPAVDAELRERIGKIAVDAARAAGYRSAGTIEGLLAPDGSYYFMEMNTRIQVEHTVTEEVTGLDLVREQILIAAGEPLSRAPGGRRVPRPRDRVPDQRGGRLARASSRRRGRITHYREPAGPGVRVDSGVVEGSEISPLYDPMIAKLIVRDVDREHARRRMLRALEEFEIGGVQTLLGFHRALLEHPCFVAGATCHGIVESERARGAGRGADSSSTAAVARRSGRLVEQRHAGRGRRAPLRGDGARVRAAAGSSSRAAGASARRHRRTARPRARSSARCRAPCSRSRSPRATRSRPAACSASSRR